MEQVEPIAILTALPPQTQIKQPTRCPYCDGVQYRKNGRNDSGSQSYWCKSCSRGFTPVAAKFEPIVNPQSEYQKDIWDCRCLGIEGGVGKSSYKLNFAPLVQPWLRETAKRYIKVCLSSLAFASAQEKLYSFRRLSRFLAQAYTEIQPAEISRSVITEFAIHLAGLSLAPQTRYKILCDVKLLFDSAYQFEWLNVSRYLVRQEDFPKRPKHLPRYIPDEVMRQLNAHLDELAEPVMRMVLVLQECGMRISELVHLKFDCLLQDKAGDWFLRYYQFKMKKEITIPISREVVRVIQEQQRYIRQHITQEDFVYLFSANGGVRRPNFNPVPKVMTRKALPIQLNRLAERHNICDSTGKRWHFQTHQFRHSVGTKLINGGVPQHIVQRYLGHESPNMTAVYAHIFDQTMKEEIAKFQGKVVNVAGQVVESITPEVETAELEWFKRNIQAQALPNGSCALPTISQGCPHANACLTCTHFRTTAEFLDEHKKQLEQTKQILDKAKANGWTRQVEMNEKVAENLRRIIEGLEREDG